MSSGKVQINADLLIAGVSSRKSRNMLAGRGAALAAKPARPVSLDRLLRGSDEALDGRLGLRQVRLRVLTPVL